jgi:hypothetical protein
MSSGQQWWRDKEREEELDQLATNNRAIDNVLALLNSEQLAMLKERIKREIVEERAKRAAHDAEQQVKKEWGL